MVQYIPAPDPRTLLPPLLACLPAAFAAARPPPALLPLLSPILRQRVQLLSATSDAFSPGSWLPLLCWDQRRASKLPKVVERMQLEPHPVSGEIEVPEVERIRYRRLDRETLHARLDLEEYGLLAIHLWCVNDEAGGGDGWRLAELRALEDVEDGTQWYGSKAEADERASEGHGGQGPGGARAPAANGTANGANGRAAPARQPSVGGGEDDDDAYWASYDRTPGRTPARTPAKRSPAPRTPRNNSAAQLPSASELEYFARYMAEVQPAMDPHDPDEEEGEGAAPGESTLSGDELSRAATTGQPALQPAGAANGAPREGGDDDPPSPSSSLPSPASPSLREINSPRPSSPPGSPAAGSVERLEAAAASQSQAEVGIKQHISTDVKSLYRLARSAGIEREEFERIVRTELELLPLMDEL